MCLLLLCAAVLFPFLVVVSVSLRLSTTASYALARIPLKGKRQLLTGLMLMQMFPAGLALVALYAIFDRIGVAFPAVGQNTHGSLVLAYSGGIAMHVWTLKGYYDTLPGEIEEAARVDGAKPWQAFWRVLLSQQDQLTLAVGSKLFVQEHNFR